MPGVQNTLTFTTANWSTAQTVTARAATDTDLDDDTATLTHSASGGGYAGRAADLPVTVTDAGDTTAPSLDGDTPPSVNGDTVTLTYDEALDTASVPGRDAFAVTVNGMTANLATGEPVARFRGQRGDADAGLGGDGRGHGGGELHRAQRRHGRDADPGRVREPQQPPPT